MKIIDDTPKLNIYCVEFEKLQQLTKEFLGIVCKNKFGVQKNNYWIFNSNLNIYENGDPLVSFFNQLLYNSQIRGYSQLMITNKPKIENPA